MASSVENFIEFKVTLFNKILNTGSDGIFESNVFKLLSEPGKNVYNYEEGLTPRKLLDSLIDNGDVVKIYTSTYSECKYVANERYLNKRYQAI